MVSDLLYHQAGFDDYVELLRLECRRMRHFMKLFDGMELLKFLRKVVVSIIPASRYSRPAQP
jgi:hypothetical protein